MQVSVTAGTKTVYQQETEDSKTLNEVVGFLMQQPQGTTVKATVINNGHALNFELTTLDIVGLVRRVNGIVTKQRTSATAAA